MDCKESLGKGEYRITINPNTKINIKLGRIRKKNDGRWNWYRWADRNGFHPKWNGGVVNSQGVCSSVEEAIMELLKGWPEDIRKTSKYYLTKNEYD